MSSKPYTIDKVTLNFRAEHIRSVKYDMAKECPVAKITTKHGWTKVYLEGAILEEFERLFPEYLISMNTIKDDRNEHPEYYV